MLPLLLSRSLRARTLLLNHLEETVMIHISHLIVKTDSNSFYMPLYRQLILPVCKRAGISSDLLLALGSASTTGLSCNRLRNIVARRTDSLSYSKLAAFGS